MLPTRVAWCMGQNDWARNTMNARGPVRLKVDQNTRIPLPLQLGLNLKYYLNLIFDTISPPPLGSAIPHSTRIQPYSRLWVLLMLSRKWSRHFAIPPPYIPHPYTMLIDHRQVSCKGIGRPAALASIACCLDKTRCLYGLPLAHKKGGYFACLHTGILSQLYWLE